MGRQEIMTTKLGEMLDMIACLAIYNGSAEPKKAKHVYSYEQAVKLR